MFRSPVSLEEWIALDGAIASVVDGGDGGDTKQSEGFVDPDAESSGGDDTGFSDSDGNGENGGQNETGFSGIAPMSIPAPSDIFSDPSWMDGETPSPTYSFPNAYQGSLVGKIYVSIAGSSIQDASILTDPRFDDCWSLSVLVNGMVNISGTFSLKLFHDETTLGFLGFEVYSTDDSNQSVISSGDTLIVYVNFTTPAYAPTWYFTSFSFNAECDNSAPPVPPTTIPTPGPGPGPGPGPNPTPNPNPTPTPSPNPLPQPDFGIDDPGPGGPTPDQDITIPPFSQDDPAGWDQLATYSGLVLEADELDMDLLEREPLIGETPWDYLDKEDLGDMPTAAYLEGKAALGRLGKALAVLRDQAVEQEVGLEGESDLEAIGGILREGDEFHDRLADEIRVLQDAASEFQATDPELRDGVMTDLIVSGAARTFQAGQTAEAVAGGLDAVADLLRLAGPHSCPSATEIGDAYADAVAMAAATIQTGALQADQEGIQFKASQARQGIVHGNL